MTDQHHSSTTNVNQTKTYRYTREEMLSLRPPVPVRKSLNLIVPDFHHLTNMVKAAEGKELERLNDLLFDAVRLGEFSKVLPVLLLNLT